MGDGKDCTDHLFSMLYKHLDSCLVGMFKRCTSCVHVTTALPVEFLACHQLALTSRDSGILKPGCLMTWNVLCLLHCDSVKKLLSPEGHTQRVVRNTGDSVPDQLGWWWCDSGKGLRTLDLPYSSVCSMHLVIVFPEEFWALSL